MKYKFSYLFAILGLLLMTANLNADSPKGQKKGNAVKKTSGTPVSAKFNINNVATWFRNDGFSDNNPLNGNSGFDYPKGSNQQVFYQSGLVWGGVLRSIGEFRVGGSTYEQGLLGGKILPNGTAQSKDLPNVRIYRVRRDYKTASDGLASEVADEGKSYSEIFNQYDKDWKEWPAADGAPYEDKDNNGSYDPNVDIPGFPGADQTIWFVSNDLDKDATYNLYGSYPMGIELQTTIWGYRQSGALGNMLFRKYTMINKGGVTVPGGGSDMDSMYVCMWSDPDLGDATDDFTGCDTVLSLGYIYNGKASDPVYGLTPPAAGFDFFQGPVVDAPGDSAIFKNKRIYDKKNLPMSAYFFFINGDDIYSDPDLGEPTGTVQFRHLMEGTISTTGAPFIDPLTGQPTKFALAGDPQTRTGWIDGILHDAYDRRFGMVAGPFTMALGDTQEVVVAQIAAGSITGVDRLGALGLLKYYDKTAQLAYDNFFNVPSAPPIPKVNTTELSQEIVVNWAFDTTSVKVAEGFKQAGFVFQGYNIYQVPTSTSSLDDAVRVVTFDLNDGLGKLFGPEFDVESGEVLTKVLQYGTDSGIQRYFSIKTDALNGNSTLLNGSRYYFALTAYAYNPDPNAVPNVIETPIQVFVGSDGRPGLVPQLPNPGVTVGSLTGEELNVNHVSGVSEGSVVPVVVDPAKTTGHNYRIEFYDYDANGNPLWKMTDLTSNVVNYAAMADQSGVENYVDGMVVKVSGPPPGVKSAVWSPASPTSARKWTSSNGNGFGLEGFSGAIGNGLDFWGVGPSYADLKFVTIRFADTDTLGNILNPSDPNVSLAYRWVRASQNAPAKPEFAGKYNQLPNYSFQDYVPVPLAVYDDDGNRLAVGFLENNMPYGMVDGKYWPPFYNGMPEGITNVSGDGPREFLFIFDAPYTPAADPALSVNFSSDETPLMYVSTVCNRYSNAAYSSADQFRITAYKVNVPGTDAFEFTAPVNTVSMDKAKEDVGNVNVFPNPYYGVNSQEVNKYQRFVTFNHLPAKATIRVFNLAGQLVRTIEKTAIGQYEKWDLLTESGLPVPSGMYIIHVDMPELGKTKILKAAIIQEKQQVDRF